MAAFAKNVFVKSCFFCDSPKFLYGISCMLKQLIPSHFSVVYNRPGYEASWYHWLAL